MTPRELYLFDLQGFIVVRGALSDEEVARLTEAIEANRDRLEKREDSGDQSHALAGGSALQALRMAEWPKPWCDPFRALIAHPTSICYLDELLGRGWHLDHMGEYIQAPKGAAGLSFHQGEYFHIGGSMYLYKGGQIRCGLTVFQWVLADQGGELGGFACIPGSHKSNFPRPVGISFWEEDREVVACPEVRAGDLIIFTEQVTHGTLPWRGDHDRRAILHRYAPAYLQYAHGHPYGLDTYRLPKWTDELDDRARLALEPAHIQQRRIVQRDGTVDERDHSYAYPPPFAYDGSAPPPYNKWSDESG
jgi:ectoine hydroxylase-related dioxygenase (phytanoyl-CoA dioxygenase family)